VRDRRLPSARRAHRARAAAGFTLIEVMITVVIVAILAAVAIPSYVDHLQRGRLADATNLLGGTRALLEQFYQDNRHYGSTAANCGVPMPVNANFNFTCDWGPNANNQSYLLTATGVGPAAGFVYTINHQGLQQTTALPAGWGAVPRNCWVNRRGGVC
jgi:type IV pilus assembly protein PilE